MKQSTTLFILFACLFFFSSTALVAQNSGNPPGWKHVNLIGGSGPDYAADVAHDNASNAYYVGAYNGQLKLGATTLQSTTHNEGFLTKVSSDGNFLWTKRFQTDGTSDTAEIVCKAVELDYAGNVVVSGYFRKGNLKIDNQVKILQGSTDLFVAKFDPSGNLLFVYSIGNETPYKLAIDNNNQIYCSTFWAIIKISPTGAKLWYKTKPNNNLGNDDIIWKDGQLYYAGNFWHQVTIGSNSILTNDLGIYICKINPANGAFSDGRLLAEGYYLDLSALSVLSDNEFYIAGTFVLSIDCEGKVDSFPNFTGQGFVAKFNSGTCNWLLTQKEPTTIADSLNTMVADGSGIVWFGGVNRGPIKFGDKSLPDSPGFLGKIDAASGTVIDLVSHSPINNISASGSDVWQAGYNNLAAVFSRNNQGGVLFEQIPENDGANCNIMSLESDDSGVYLSATILGKVKFLDLNLNIAQSSMLIAKADLKTEHVIWHTVIPGAIASGRLPGNTGIFDKNAHKFYTIGSFADSIIYNGQTINATDPALAKTYFIVQTNADGSAGWLRVLEVSDINGLAIDGLGNAIVGGIFNGQINIGNTNLESNGDDDFFVTKLDPNGNYLWTKRGGGQHYEFSASPTVDASGNIYITVLSHSLLFDWHNEWTLNTQEGEGNIFLLKISPDGTLQWGKLFGGENPSNITGLEDYCYLDNTFTDGGGNTFMCGHFGKLSKFGPITLTSKFLYNNFIGKFDTNGTPVWITPIQMKEFGGSLSEEIDLDENGNVYCALPMKDSVFIGNQAFKRRGGLYSMNMLFCRFNGTTGALEWAKQTFGRWETIIHATSISVHDSKSIFSAGLIFEIAGFDNTKLNTQNGNSSFLNLLGEDVIVAVHTLPSEEKVLEIFPNPARMETNIRAKDASLSGVYEITIHNEKGDLVKSATVNDLSQAQRLSLSGLPSGVYYVTVNNDQTSETVRLVVD